MNAVSTGHHPAAADRVRAGLARLAQAAGDVSLRAIRRVLFPRGRAPQRPETVLVHLVGNIGDVIVATPLLQSLSDRYPSARIVLLTSVGRTGPAGAAALLGGADAIDEIVEYDVDAVKRIGELRTLVGGLRARRPDVVVLCPAMLTTWRRNVRNLLFARLIGPRVATVPRVPVVRWSLGAQVRVRGWFPHESVRYLGLADELRPGPRPARRPVDLGPLDADTADRVERCTPPGRIVAVCPGGKQVPHRWPEARFVDVVEALGADPQLSFVAVGNAAERELCERVLQPVADRSRNAAGALSVRGTAELLRRCALLLTNDTGPMHLAAAHDVPVVAVFGGAMPPGMWYPWAHDARVLRAEAACRTCLDRPEQPHCVERIRTPAVLRACRDALDGEPRGAAGTASCLLVDPTDGSTLGRIVPTDHGWRDTLWTPDDDNDPGDGAPAPG